MSSIDIYKAKPGPTTFLVYAIRNLFTRRSQNSQSLPDAPAATPRPENIIDNQPALLSPPKRLPENIISTAGPTPINSIAIQVRDFGLRRSSDWNSKPWPSESSYFSKPSSVPGEKLIPEDLLDVPGGPSSVPDRPHKHLHKRHRSSDSSACRASLSNFCESRMETKIYEAYVLHTKRSSDGATVLEEAIWDEEGDIGFGSAGSVSLQRKRGQGELRAVKTLIQPKERLSHELLALIELKEYDHLFVKFLGWYQDKRYMFIVMEYIEDGDLGEYIRQSDRAASGNAKAITTQILQGLEVLHEKKIYHRDIKPKNILVARLNPIWVKIADFGVSKLALDTTLKTGWGTECYRSPEITGAVFRKREDPKFPAHALDIWPLGCLVHELLTSQTPFTKASYLAATEMYTEMTTVGRWQAMDFDMSSLFDYCRGKKEFPIRALQEHEVGQEGITFVKRLLNPYPPKRPTATEALLDQWLIGNVRSL